mgnify:FL=1
MNIKLAERLAIIIGGGITEIEQRTGAILDTDENNNNLIIRDIKNSEVIKNINVNYNETSDIIEIEFFDKDLKLLKTTTITTGELRELGEIIDVVTNLEWSSRRRL